MRTTRWNTHTDRRSMNIPILCDNDMLWLSLGIHFLMLICENIAVGKEVSDEMLDRKKRSKSLTVFLLVY